MVLAARPSRHIGIGGYGSPPEPVIGPAKPDPLAATTRSFAATTAYTAILRWRTGAPAVRPSAASMMALASMAWWR